MKKYLLLFICLFVFCSFLKNSTQNSLLKNYNEKITLIFAGDIMGHSPQYQAAYNPTTKTYNYDICFRYVKSYIQNADFAVGNLEVPIAGKPYNGYPNFSSPDALLDALKNSGFNVLLTANNHAIDRGEYGVERTIRQLKKRNLLFAGCYLNKDQRDSIYPLIIESKGIKIALLNCTYGTNHKKVSGSNFINYIDTLEIVDDIRKANRLGVDFRVMTIHWGNEYVLHANEFQTNLSKFLVNNGINLIIGSHPHVVQNAEILYDKDNLPVPVFYSLGNFISNQRELNTNGGVIIKVEIDTKSKKIRNTSFLPVYVYRGILNGEYQYHLIPTTDFIKKTSLFRINKTDSIMLREFHKNTCQHLYNQNLMK